MMQGFALHCVATGSAYKMIWMAKLEKFLFLHCVAVQIILKALLVTMQRSANPASHYKPALIKIRQRYLN